VEKIIYPVNYFLNKEQQDYLDEEKLQEYFAKHLTSNGWQRKNCETQEGKLVAKLNSAGRTCLQVIKTNIRLGITPIRILLGYQNVFYYL
jgi:hypothetical protein